MELLRKLILSVAMFMGTFSAFADDYLGSCVPYVNKSSQYELRQDPNDLRIFYIYDKWNKDKYYGYCLFKK